MRPKLTLNVEGTSGEFVVILRAETRNTRLGVQSDSVGRGVSVRRTTS